MLMQRPYPSTSEARKPRYLDLPRTRKLSARPSLGFLLCGGGTTDTEIRLEIS